MKKQTIAALPGLINRNYISFFIIEWDDSIDPNDELSLLYDVKTLKEETLAIRAQDWSLLTIKSLFIYPFKDKYVLLKRNIIDHDQLS